MLYDILMQTECKTQLTDAKRRLAIDARFAINHVGHKRWDIISKNMGPEYELWTHLFKIGKTAGTATGKTPVQPNQMYYGEENYLCIRPELVTKKLVPAQSLNKIDVSMDPNGKIDVSMNPNDKIDVSMNPNDKIDVSMNPNDKIDVSMNPNGKIGVSMNPNGKIGVSMNPNDKIDVSMDPNGKIGVSMNPNDKIDVSMNPTGKTMRKKVKSDIPAKKQAKKPPTKASIIIQENTVKKIRADLNSLTENLNLYLPHKSAITFTAKFSETIIIKMMIQCKNLLDRWIDTNNKIVHGHRDQTDLILMKTTLHRELVELISAYHKIYLEKSTNSAISSTCVSDLLYWIDRTKQTINFVPDLAIIQYPEFIFKTVYDSMLNKVSADLYPSQKEIFKFVTTNTSYLALVHTMLGSGKTSMILPLSGWLTGKYSQKNTTNKILSVDKILFCCPNEVVLLEVAHMVYGMGLSFALLIYNKQKNYLEYKWSTFADKKNARETAILYICDIFVCRILLEERQQAMREKELYYQANKRDPLNYPMSGQRIPIVPEYILMADELTKDSDNQDNYGIVDGGFSLGTELFVDLMRLAPAKIILMSATLPTIEQTGNLYHSIIKSHPGMVVKSFSSTEAKIGCALISMTGTVYAPHHHAQTADEINHILSVIKTNPFVGRFYTFEIVLHLYRTLQEANINVPTISHIMEDPTKATQNNIQELAYEMLATLSKHDSYTIYKICRLTLYKTPVKPNNLITDPRLIKGSTIIFCTDPVQMALDQYGKIFNFEQIRFGNILETYHKQLKRFDGLAHKQANNPTTDKSNKTDKSGKLESDAHPDWKFPAQYQLSDIGPTDLPADSNAPINVITMLASGIGIYSSDHPLLDDAYSKTVLFLAKQNRIPILFADSSIAYGTNLAVSNIVIVDEPVTINNKLIEPIIDKHSMKTIFQMLGRAGRGGSLSYEAHIFTVSPQNRLINKICQYIRGTLDEGVCNEVANINRAYDIIWEKN